MQSTSRFTHTVALIVALGGFLMGFDASVISGVVGSIEIEFDLTKLELGWSVSSLALTATLGMMVSGPLSDRIGRHLLASGVRPGDRSLVLVRPGCRWPIEPSAAEN